MALLVSTTGSVRVVDLQDLGSFKLTHPVVAFDLTSQFSQAELAESEDVRAAFVSGALTLVDSQGVQLDVPASQALLPRHSELRDLEADTHSQYLDVVRGDLRYYAKTAIDAALALINSSLAAHKTDPDNPHQVTKNHLGLGSVLDVAQIPAAEKGQPEGVATLGVDQKIPTEQLPASVLGGQELIDVYDAAGDQYFTREAITVKLNVIRKNTSAATFTLTAADEIVVLKAGLLTFQYRISVNNTRQSGTGYGRWQRQYQMQAWLERDVGVGWTTLAGTRSFDHGADRDKGTVTLSSFGAFDAAAGTKIRIRTARIEGSKVVKTVAGGSSLMLTLQGA